MKINIEMDCQAFLNITGDMILHQSWKVQPQILKIQKKMINLPHSLLFIHLPVWDMREVYTYLHTYMNTQM